eukprot:2505766-Rhodomonas_salina.1
MAPPASAGVRLGCFDQWLASTSLRSRPCLAPTQRVGAQSSSLFCTLVWLCGPTAWAAALGSSQARPLSAHRLRLAVTGSPDLDCNGCTLLREQLGNKTLYL